MRKIIIFTVLFSALFLLAPIAQADEEREVFLIHLKTSLDHDDSQICVAYNMIWAALEEGFDVKVLVDADAANTFKIGWLGKDDIEDFDLPLRLRKSLSEQFNVPLEEVPEKYGPFLMLLEEKGAEFYINSAFLVLAKIEKRMGSVENISAKFFRPVALKEMVDLRRKADYYMAY
ncbi:MAG: hypothetical protein PVG55_05920 [Nitrospirota bacterium]|jgi:hypothetical protein